MEPSSPFYQLSPGAFGIPTASAFTWDFNQTVGREIVPLPRVTNQAQPYPLPILSACSPLPVPTNPLLWSKEDVERWLRWCTKEFALSNLDPKSFSMNGKALCLLPKESFRHRTAQSGDVLYEILQKLIYYNNYLNRQARNQEARYPSPPTLLQQTSRLSPPNHSPTSSTPSVLHHTYRDYTNIVAGGHCENGMTSYDPKDAAATLGHGVLPTVPLNLKTADTQSSTPCSDSGNSSPGMVEDDHQQSLAHPLSRHGAANSSQIRNEHRCIEPDQHCRNANKRHRSVSDLDDGHTMGARVSKRANTLDDTGIGLVESDIPRHYIMQRRPHEPVKHSTISESQRLPERDSQLIYHRQADVIQQPHENSQNKMIPTYPIPISLPFLESCGPRAVYIRGDENRRLYHDDEIDAGEDDIFANGEKPSDCRLLWEFLSQLLRQEKYSPYIKWEDEEKRVFRIQDPTAIASLWGRQKNRTNMTYEKLSRALRYYYKTGIIQKEPGQKLTYRFLQDPKDIANSQRFSKGNRSKASNAPSPQQAATAEDFHDSCPSSPHSADDSSAINDTNTATTVVNCSPETDGDLKDSTVTDDRIQEMSKTPEPKANTEEADNQEENVISAAVEQSGGDRIRSESVLAMNNHCMVIKREPCPTEPCHAE